MKSVRTPSPFEGAIFYLLVFSASIIVAFINFYVNDKTLAGLVAATIMVTLFAYEWLATRKSIATSEEVLDIMDEVLPAANRLADLTQEMCSIVQDTTHLIRTYENSTDDNLRLELDRLSGHIARYNDVLTHLKENVKQLTAALERKKQEHGTLTKPHNDAPFEEWFEFYNRCKAKGIRYSLKDMAKDVKYDYSYIRKKHSEYQKEMSNEQ